MGEKRSSDCVDCSGKGLSGTGRLYCLVNAAGVSNSRQRPFPYKSVRPSLTSVTFLIHARHNRLNAAAQVMQCQRSHAARHVGMLQVPMPVIMANNTCILLHLAQPCGSLLLNGCVALIAPHSPLARTKTGPSSPSTPSGLRRASLHRATSALWLRTSLRCSSGGRSSTNR